MSHLTDEQIERLIEDPECRDQHANQCGLCKDRLEDALAIRRRLPGGRRPCVLRSTTP